MEYFYYYKITKATGYGELRSFASVGQPESVPEDMAKEFMALWNDISCKYSYKLSPAQPKFPSVAFGGTGSKKKGAKMGKPKFKGFDPKQPVGAILAQTPVQGSAREPYTVSEHADGNYACSCPNWTQHSPRTDCKHILRVQLDRLKAAGVSVGMNVSGGVTIQINPTGRKFRR